MALQDRLNEPPTAHPNAGCAVGWFLATLDDGERAALDELAQAHTAARLARIVQEEGYTAADGTPIPAQTFARHRRKDCRCDAAGLA